MEQYSVIFSRKLESTRTLRWDGTQRVRVYVVLVVRNGDSAEFVNGFSIRRTSYSLTTVENMAQG